MGTGRRGTVEGTGRVLVRPLVTLVVAAALGLAVWELLVNDTLVPGPTAESLTPGDQHALERLLARPDQSR